MATNTSHQGKAVLMRDLDDMKIKDFVSVTMESVRKSTLKMVQPALNELADRCNENVRAINVLIQRVKELESKKMSFRGVWQADVQYERGDLVMRKNGLFYCNSPGVKGFDPREARGSDSWKMMTTGGSANRELERD